MRKTGDEVRMREAVKTGDGAEKGDAVRGEFVKTGETVKTGDGARTGGQRGSRRKAPVRGRAAALAAAVVLALAGCGNEGKPVEVSGEKIAGVSGEDLSGAGGENPAGGSGEDLSGAGGEDLTGANGQQAAGKGYLFTAKGVTVAVDAEAGPITEQLGEPLSYFESKSCAFEGLDKSYTYSGFELDTYPKDDKDYVSAVVLTDDSVATPEGVAIGDSLERVKEVYPGEGEEVCGMLKYEKDGMTLIFVIQEDEVVSIEYRTNILQ